MAWGMIFFWIANNKRLVPRTETHARLPYDYTSFPFLQSRTTYGNQFLIGIR